MDAHSLGRIFDPKRIALVGALPNPNSVGGKVLSNLVTGGFPGVVYPVHPTQEAVLGIPCFADVASLPKVPDLAIVCTPAEQVPAAVAACGEAGIRALRSLFNWATHEAAARHYYIDYAREIAIVAEIEVEGERRLIGVGRLIADPGHEEVEYAVLVVDAWQHRELGSILTDTCIEIARGWNLKRIVAQTSTANRAMISVFERRGFEVRIGDDSTVDVSLAL